MASFQGKYVCSFFLIFFFSCIVVSVSSHSRHYTPPNVPLLTNIFPHVSVDRGFYKSFGTSNVQATGNGSSVTIALDKTSGAGLISRNKYHYGFFSVAIKLPSSITSGVVVAFYLSNSDVYPKTHDEVDIELLGHDKRNDWVIQTNIYSSGRLSIGREEKFHLWFDPTLEHHYYSIVWNSHHILFLLDNIPLREIPNVGAFSSIYPSKPMSVYATIWDGSEWATHGGKYPVNYKYAPFIASLAQIEMAGCVSNPTATNTTSTSPTCLKSASSEELMSAVDPVEGPEFARLSQQQRSALDWARQKLMLYSYCKDTSRYKVLPPECI